MSKNPKETFDESLLSGYLDGELTQSEAQRVRIRLEDDETVRETFEQMKALRLAAQSTPFFVPDDGQWNERPRSGTSRVARRLGWSLVTVWAVALAGFFLWQVIVSPQHLLEKLLVFGAVSGFGLLFTSVLLDRLKALKTDRYQRVEK